MLLDYDEREKELEIYLEFDPYKQIEILLDDYVTVIKRKKDLDIVKNYLKFQKFMPKVRLRENLSNNPINLIHDFLEQEELTLEQLKEEGFPWNDYGNGKMKEFLDKLEEYENKDEREKEFGGRLESDVFGYGRNAIKFVEEYLGQIHSVMKARG